jgi:hypothetical protein
MSTHAPAIAPWSCNREIFLGMSCGRPFLHKSIIFSQFLTVAAPSNHGGSGNSSHQLQRPPEQRLEIRRCAARFRLAHRLFDSGPRAAQI